MDPEESSSMDLEENPPPVVDSLKEDERKERIVKLLEFYFSDLNLMKDKFLRNIIATTPIGFVPVTIIAKFKRMKTLIKDSSEIVSVVGRTNPLLETQRVRRKWYIGRRANRPLPDLTDEFLQGVSERTLFIKGFSKDDSTTSIVNFLETFGTVDLVKKRKFLNKPTKTWIFKGSIYATFPTEVEARNFLSLKSLKYNNSRIECMPQPEFVRLKLENRLRLKLVAEREKNDVMRMFEDKVIPFPRKTLIRLTNVPETMSNNKLRQMLKSVWKVAQILYDRSRAMAIVRMYDEDTAAEVLLSLPDKTLRYNGIELKAEAIEDSEEEENILRKMALEKHSKLTGNTEIDIEVEKLKLTERILSSGSESTDSEEEYFSSHSTASTGSSSGRKRFCVKSAVSDDK